MKKLTAIFLAICMILMLTACNFNKDELSDDWEVTVTTVTIGGDKNKTDSSKDDNVSQKNETHNSSSTSVSDKNKNNNVSSNIVSDKNKTDNVSSNTNNKTDNKEDEPVESTTRPSYPSVPQVKKDYATDRKLKIACVGDSITESKYYINNMQGKLSTDNYEVTGFGVSGATAMFNGVDWGGASNLPNINKAYVNQPEYTNSLNYGADIVVIMLGTNDSKDVNWPYHGEEFLDDYIKIIRSYQNSASKPMVFVALPPTVFSIGAFQGISDYRIANYINPLLKEAVSATGAILVDTYKATANQSYVTDGVHPSQKGKEAICAVLAEAICKDTGRK